MYCAKWSYVYDHMHAIITGGNCIMRKHVRVAVSSIIEISTNEVCKYAE